MEPKTKLDVTKAEAVRIRERVSAVRTIEGATGTSRLATVGDAPGLLKLLSDERVSGDVYTLPRPFSLRSISAWIKDHEAQAKDGVGLLMVTEDESGDIITLTDFQFWPEHAACEFGGVIAAHLQSQHIGTKGMAHLCDWVFTELGIRLLVMTASVDNIRSHKLLRGLNFTQMGEMDSVRPDGSVRQSLYWELGRE
ncbi:MAG: GNAT family N-acetyltransferase [Robiginitomaculum sp.]|nr:GNAT family N-acetyltransferase [Robiginitomaculum sp.]